MVWLKSRGYKLVRQQILKARKYRRTELLLRQREEGHKISKILPKHTNLNYHLRSAYIPLDHKISIALLRMQFTFLLVKPAINNTKKALKNSGVDLIIR